MHSVIGEVTAQARRLRLKERSKIEINIASGPCSFPGTCPLYPIIAEET